MVISLNELRYGANKDYVDVVGKILKKDRSIKKETALLKDAFKKLNDYVWASLNKPYLLISYLLLERINLFLIRLSIRCSVVCIDL